MAYGASAPRFSWHEVIYIGFEEIIFNDRTINVDVPDSYKDYIGVSGVATTGLKTGPYLKYALSSSVDANKNILEAFSETSKSGTLNFSSGNNIIIADGQAKTLRGLDGDDIYFVTESVDNIDAFISESGDSLIMIPHSEFLHEQWIIVRDLISRQCWYFQNCFFHINTAL